MKYKVGDTVRIQSREWIEAQEKDNDGEILPPTGTGFGFSVLMQRHAGKAATITDVAANNKYCIDIEPCEYVWEDWMFDPGHRPNEPLTPEDAIRAMLDGETLYDKNGNKCVWDKVDKNFHVFSLDDEFVCQKIDVFTDLRRRPEKRKRLMTRWEILAWTTSEESRGWVVRISQDTDWVAPQCRAYNESFHSYQRAKLLPDGSGIDESTIQGFEVEE